MFGASEGVLFNLKVPQEGRKEPRREMKSPGSNKVVSGVSPLAPSESGRLPCECSPFFALPFCKAGECNIVTLLYSANIYSISQVFEYIYFLMEKEEVIIASVRAN